LNVVLSNSTLSGEDGRELCLALNGIVYDVSSGSQHYGKGGGYRLFAGRDASRCLAKGSLDEADIPTLVTDNLVDLTEDEVGTLKGWVQMFSKYPRVGVLEGFISSAAEVEPTKVFAAARSGKTEDLRQALKGDPDWLKDEDKLYDDTGATPLHIAASEGYLECVKVLLESGVDKDILNLASKETPLIGAARGDHAEVLKYLLSLGADPEAKDAMGYTSLIHASMHVSLKVMEELIKGGADATYGDAEGWTCLHWAAAKDTPKSIDKLCQLNALDVDAQDKAGNTSLHWAGKYGNANAYKALVKNKASETILNSEGEAPQLAAEKAHQTDCVIS
ncbi:hypothetical protein SARC_08315, partial [Sphaeroforma arctica JP610]